MDNMIVTLRITPGGEVRAINIIKAIRTITGWGLKDAKHFVDCSRVDEQTTKLVDANPKSVADQIQIIREAGGIVKVVSSYDMYVDQLKEIAVAATLKGDFYVASILTDFLDKNFG